MKADSAQIYVQRINAVIDHVNQHLDQQHTLEELARISHFSKFHFHRLFKGITGETVADFVKRLRLERAVKLLRRVPNLSITEVALSCGFESSSDFSRSFTQRYGFSPRQFEAERFREDSKICQDLAANLHYPLRRQDAADNPDGFVARLDEVPPCTLAYVRVFGAFDPNRILDGMNQLIEWGRAQGHYPKARLMGMSQDDMDITPTDKYRYDWCLAVPANTPESDTVTTRYFAGGTYASVGCVGDIKLLDRAWQWLFDHWLPGSGYQPRDFPAIEWYETDPTVSGWETFNLRCCIPVQQLLR